MSTPRKITVPIAGRVQKGMPKQELSPVLRKNASNLKNAVNRNVHHGPGKE
jgi:hypothetical protein